MYRCHCFWYTRITFIIWSCNVTKEADYDIWWKFGEEYYTLTIVDGTDVLKKLNPKSDTAESVTDSLIAVIRDGLSVTKYDDPESLGHQTKQVRCNT